MAPSEAIRIVIVDGHPVVRERLRTLFGAESVIEIVGEAANADDAVRIVETLAPDVVLMDVALSGGNAIVAAAAINAQKLPPKVILITSALGDDLHLQEAIEAGVMGYLLNDISKSELLQSIQCVHRGAPVFHPSIQKQLLRRAADEQLPHGDLTPRELDILKELAKGKSNKAIAHDLTLTEGTVKGYVSVVLSKLGVDDRTQAALYAVRHGLTKE